MLMWNPKLRGGQRNEQNRPLCFRMLEDFLNVKVSLSATCIFTAHGFFLTLPYYKIAVQLRFKVYNPSELSNKRLIKKWDWILHLAGGDFETFFFSLQMIFVFCIYTNHLLSFKVKEDDTVHDLQLRLQAET